MRLPLYKYNEIPLSSGINPNPGLEFDKFPKWQDNPRESLAENVKTDFLKGFIGRDNQYLNNNLDNYLERREKMLGMIKGIECRAKTSWRLVSGLGSSHPYETGLIWHRTLGVPYLSGSAIKGVIRSWLIEWDGDKELATRLFGDDSDLKNPKPGNLIVFDAIPKCVPKLEMDILNPHYQPYYENPANNPPADYYNPVPVYFLTVATKQIFSFALAPRLSAYGVNDEEQIRNDLKEGKKALYDALENIGAGGKTAVGYGLFEAVTTGGNSTEEIWIDAHLQTVSGVRGINGMALQATFADKTSVEPLNKFDFSNNQKRKLKPPGITKSVSVKLEGGKYSIVKLND